MQTMARGGCPNPELAANKGSIGDESQSSRAGISNPAYVQPLGCSINVRRYADPVIRIRIPIRIHKLQYSGIFDGNITLHFQRTLWISQSYADVASVVVDV